MSFYHRSGFLRNIDWKTSTPKEVYFHQIRERGVKDENIIKASWNKVVGFSVKLDKDDSGCTLSKCKPRPVEYYTPGDLTQEH